MTFSMSDALANAVLAWIWLDVALVACGDGAPVARRYFFAYESPWVEAWLGVVSSHEAV